MPTSLAPGRRRQEVVDGDARRRQPGDLDRLTAPSDRHAAIASLLDRWIRADLVYGTLAAGGDFETVFARFVLRDSAELFEIEDLDVAPARFEELRPR